MGKEKASWDLHTTAQHNCGFKNKQNPNNNSNTQTTTTKPHARKKKTKHKPNTIKRVLCFKVTKNNINTTYPLSETNIFLATQIFLVRRQPDF